MPDLEKCHFILAVLYCFHYAAASHLVCGSGPKVCKPSNIRSFDGSCNNLKRPTWGSRGTSYGRLLPAKYGDGELSFALAVSGKPLPNARLLSRELYPGNPVEDPRFTMLAMQYGQFLAHDISYTAISTPVGCCSRDFQFLDPEKTPPSCAPIEIPEDDPDYAPLHAVCMGFQMTDTTKVHGCSLNKKHSEKINDVTTYLDLNMIYSVSEEKNRNIRTFQDGLLISRNVNGEEYCKPLQKPSPECAAQNFANCFDTDIDKRINQNLELAMLHVIFWREHNRLARELKTINPDWDDEKLFQEARRINIAQHEHIVYQELLPIYLGEATMVDDKLLRRTRGYVNDYDENVKTEALNEFSQAAFRFLHSLCWAHLFLFSERRDLLGIINLVDFFNNPEPLEKNDTFDKLSIGLLTQPTFAADKNVDPDLTKFLFKDPHLDIGKDLRAIDIQRGRDHGLPSYNDMREFCGLGRVENFDELHEVFDIDTINKLKELYENVNDIDLSVGGSLERLEPESLFGPTFLCIMKQQFRRIRFGDRLFYENAAAGFTVDQLNEIRKITVSKIMCANIKNLKAVQPRGFETISEENPLTLCSDMQSLNLTKWKKR